MSTVCPGKSEIEMPKIPAYRADALAYVRQRTKPRRLKYSIPVSGASSHAMYGIERKDIERNGIVLPTFSFLKYGAGKVAFR